MKDTTQTEIPVSDAVVDEPVVDAAVDEPVVDEPVVEEPVIDGQASYDDRSDGAPNMWRLWRDRWTVYYADHSHAVVYGLVGAIAAILMLIMGFWPVLLIALLAFIGVALGQWQDGNPRIILFLVRLFRRRS